ncbi:MAG TPA: hypothetical protein VJR58_04755 [Vineibacter sp.]|nr:hypothetical protein [Vineibacter sp.]
MSRRVALAFVLGVAAASLGSMAWERLLVVPAHAQKEPMSDRQHYLLVLAIGNALSSLAVDSERTATNLNDLTDQVKALEGRLRQAERRIGDLERTR